MGYSMSIGNVLHKIIYEINSFCNDDCESSLFDFVFKDVMCETQQNEEQSQKNLDNELFCKNDLARVLTSDSELEQKLYLTLSAFFASGFYFSLTQPPD
jgi:hypothetical protein